MHIWPDAEHPSSKLHIKVAKDIKKTIWDSVLQFVVVCDICADCGAWACLSVLWLAF